MTRFCLCFFTPPSTAPSVPPLLSHSRPVFFKQLQSWLQLTHEAKSPQLPLARPTVAQPTSSANPFRTACLSVSARGRQMAWSSMHTPFPRRRDPSQPQEAPAPAPPTPVLSTEYHSVYLLVCLLGCHNSPNSPISWSHFLKSEISFIYF